MSENNIEEKYVKIDMSEGGRIVLIGGRDDNRRNIKVSDFRQELVMIGIGSDAWPKVVRNETRLTRTNRAFSSGKDIPVFLRTGEKRVRKGIKRGIVTMQDVEGQSEPTPAITMRAHLEGMKLIIEPADHPKAKEFQALYDSMFDTLLPEDVIDWFKTYTIENLNGVKVEGGGIFTQPRVVPMVENLATVIGETVGVTIRPLEMLARGPNTVGLVVDGLMSEVEAMMKLVQKHKDESPNTVPGKEWRDARIADIEAKRAKLAEYEPVLGMTLNTVQAQLSAVTMMIGEMMLDK